MWDSSRIGCRTLPLILTFTVLLKCKVALKQLTPAKFVHPPPPPPSQEGGWEQYAQRKSDGKLFKQLH